MSPQAFKMFIRREIGRYFYVFRFGRPDSDRRLLAQLGEENKSGNDRFHLGPHDNRQYSIEAPFNRGGDDVRRRLRNTDLFHKTEIQQTRSHSPDYFGRRLLKNVEDVFDQKELQQLEEEKHRRRLNKFGNRRALKDFLFGDRDGNGNTAELLSSRDNGGDGAS